jgi:hypothetical protein
VQGMWKTKRNLTLSYQYILDNPEEILLFSTIKWPRTWFSGWNSTSGLSLASTDDHEQTRHCTRAAFTQCEHSGMSSAKYIELDNYQWLQ